MSARRDPDAKVGMTKHGAWDMIYKPEHVTDLESGAIVAATVRPGNDGETEDLAQRVLYAGETLSRACHDPRQAKFLQSLTADEGYFSMEEICALQGERIHTVVGDPHAAHAAVAGGVRLLLVWLGLRVTCIAREIPDLHRDPRIPGYHPQLVCFNPMVFSTGC